MTKRGLYIYGIIGNSDNWDIDVPEDLTLSGYMTSDGLRFCITKKLETKIIDLGVNVQSWTGSLFGSQFFTEDEVKTYIIQYKRKCKLQQLIQKEQ